MLETTSASTSYNCKLLWFSWRRIAINKRNRVLWDLSAAYTLWGIWRERNNRILITLSDHLNKIFMFALFLLLIGSISFQAKSGRRRTEFWTTHRGGTSPTVARRTLRVGGYDTDSDDMSPVAFRSPDFWISCLP